MAYPESLRKWITRAFGGQSGAYTISEERGIKRSQMKAEQVHHIYGESDTLHHGENPNTSEPLPLGKKEHVGQGWTKGENGKGRTAQAGEEGHSFHPALGRAVAKAYEDGNEDKIKEYIKNELENGEEPLINTDWGVQQWLADRAREIMGKYSAEHPEDPRPHAPRHKRISEHWTTGYEKEHPNDIPPKGTIFTYDGDGNITGEE